MRGGRSLPDSEMEGKGGSTYGGLRLSAESMRSLYICFAYGCSSILISLIYKALLRCARAGAARQWGAPPSLLV